MAPTASCSHKEALPTDGLNISWEVTQCGLWRVMSRLERCPCLVITGLHLLPTACSSSSITAFAASPPSSRNEAGKSARDGRDDCLHANSPLEENKGVKIWREQTVVLRRRSHCQPDVSMQPWEPSCQTTYSIFVRSENIDLPTKITKTNPDGDGMEVNSIKPLSEDQHGGNGSRSRTGLKLFIAPEWCTVKGGRHQRLRR